MTTYHLIAAVGPNRELGFKNQLPWGRLPSDLARFKSLTSGNGNNAVVMGRNTFLSLRYPLPGRRNVVISSLDLDFDTSSAVVVVRSLGTVFRPHFRQFDEVWFIGGSRVYEDAFKYPLQSVELTRIQESFPADCFFPPVPNKYQGQSRSNVLVEKGVSFYFETLRS